MKHGPSRVVSAAFSFPNMKALWERIRSCPLGFLMEVLLQSWLTKFLASGSWFNLHSPLSSLEIRGWDWTFQPPNHRVGDCGNQPHPWVGSKIIFPEAFSGSKDKRPNIILLLFIDNEIPSFGDFWAKNCGWRSYILCLYIFLIKHNISHPFALPGFTLPHFSGSLIKSKEQTFFIFQDA